MKKILGLSIAALLVIAMVGGGTWAYFNDTESSVGNTITAGTLDLNWDGGNESDNYTFQIAAADGWPGNSNNSTFKLIKNVGSLDGELDIELTDLLNTESSGGTEHEADGVGGELGSFAKIAPWIDIGKDGAFTPDTDIALTSAGGVSTAALQWDTIDSFVQIWDAVVSTMSSGDEYRFYIAWEIPGEATDNTAQGDSVSFGVTFTLEQAAAD